MSTSTKEWLLVIPDKPNALSTRVSMRDKHLAGLKPLVQSGKALFGGALLEEHPPEGAPWKFKGSAVLLTAETEAEVRKVLENDTYAKNGVWDLENLQIFPVSDTCSLGASVTRK